MRTRTVLALVYVAATSALGCGGKLEDGSASSAKTYGALDVADGTCAPVVAQTVACGALPSFAAICTVGNKPAVHVLQQDLVLLCRIVAPSDDTSPPVPLSASGEGVLARA